MNDALHGEAERLLTVAKIWKLGNFGWLNAYDADPDLIGHAQWQTDPPIDNPMVFNARGTHKAAQPEPPEWLRTIAIAGADFEGLMEAARMSMGLLLLSIDAARGKDFVNDAFFDLHRMSALIYLATATERLRELFIAAAFRQGQEDYNRSKDKVHGEPRRKFSSPFIEAADKFTNCGCLSKLIALAPDIVKMRDERNILVHEIATEIAQRERQSHAQQSGPPPPTVENFQALQSMRAALRERFARERETAIQNLSDRYSLLVRVSNEIFEFENYVRRRP
ncbi:hypothetical protein [Bradyrhizobium sp. Ash2021]|uniref:hypothetical protein n=1 Tax=Bradyrhizobium sp. Ash2021 TaxID=2954771 RepID=UPI0028149DB4|nr:hypothetical protein [Bradyrhizobium sp. Ash2021]WMT71912.1 hypothetical protein NL528_28035 [Bradyrhizobium sp. Ash2021]